MKLTTLFLFLSICLTCKSQRGTEYDKIRIDSIILSNKIHYNEHQFDAISSQKKYDTIHYSYSIHPKNIISINRRFKKEEINCEQNFVIEKSKLIYVAEIQTSYSSERQKLDSILGEYYFIDGQIFTYKSAWIGNKKLSRENPQSELLLDLNEAMAALNRYKQNKNGN